MMEAAATPAVKALINGFDNNNKEEHNKHNKTSCGVSTSASTGDPPGHNRTTTRQPTKKTKAKQQRSNTKSLSNEKKKSSSSSSSNNNKRRTSLLLQSVGKQHSSSALLALKNSKRKNMMVKNQQASCPILVHHNDDDDDDNESSTQTPRTKPKKHVSFSMDSFCYDYPPTPSTPPTSDESESNHAGDFQQHGGNNIAHSLDPLDQTQHDLLAPPLTSSSPKTTSSRKNSSSKKGSGEGSNSNSSKSTSKKKTSSSSTRHRSSSKGKSTSFPSSSSSASVGSTATGSTADMTASSVATTTNTTTTTDEKQVVVVEDQQEVKKTKHHKSDKKSSSSSTKTHRRKRRAASDTCAQAVMALNEQRKNTTTNNNNNNNNKSNNTSSTKKAPPAVTRKAPARTRSRSLSPPRRPNDTLPLQAGSFGQENTAIANAGRGRRDSQRAGIAQQRRSRSRSRSLSPISSSQRPTDTLPLTAGSFGRRQEQQGSSGFTKKSTAASSFVAARGRRQRYQAPGRTKSRSLSPVSISSAPPATAQRPTDMLPLTAASFGAPKKSSFSPLLSPGLKASDVQAIKQKNLQQAKQQQQQQTKQRAASTTALLVEQHHDEDDDDNKAIVVAQSRHRFFERATSLRSLANGSVVGKAAAMERGRRRHSGRPSLNRRKSRSLSPSMRTTASEPPPPVAMCFSPVTVRKQNPQTQWLTNSELCAKPVFYAHLARPIGRFQAVVRGVAARRACRGLIQERLRRVEHDAAACLQASARARLGVLRYRQMQKQAAAAIVLQALVRGFVTHKSMRVPLLEHRLHGIESDMDQQLQDIQLRKFRHIKQLRQETLLRVGQEERQRKACEQRMEETKTLIHSLQHENRSLRQENQGLQRGIVQYAKKNHALIRSMEQTQKYAEELQVTLGQLQRDQERLQTLSNDLRERRDQYQSSLEEGDLLWEAERVVADRYWKAITDICRHSATRLHASHPMVQHMRRTTVETTKQYGGDPLLSYNKKRPAVVVAMNAKKGTN